MIKLRRSRWPSLRINLTVVLVRSDIENLVWLRCTESLVYQLLAGKRQLAASFSEVDLRCHGNFAHRKDQRARLESREARSASVRIVNKTFEPRLVYFCQHRLVVIAALVLRHLQVPYKSIQSWQEHRSETHIIRKRRDLAIAKSPEKPNYLPASHFFDRTYQGPRYYRYIVTEK